MNARFLRLLLPALLGLASIRCDFIDETFDCSDLRVDLVNSQQSTAAVDILVEDESPTPQTLLASGASRRVGVCVQRGDAKRFHAVRDNQTLATANCVVSRASYEYSSNVARVVWDARGLSCENW